MPINGCLRAVIFNIIIIKTLVLLKDRWPQISKKNILEQCLFCIHSIGFNPPLFQNAFLEISPQLHSILKYDNRFTDH